ncbi:MAG TPA: hypothetical protein VKA08_15310 [Balneolales bacterium]|nr:hypothetical protein [Balneolales bacterium]
MEKIIPTFLFDHRNSSKSISVLVILTGMLMISVIPSMAQTSGISKGDIVRVSSPILGDKMVRGKVVNISSQSIEIVSNGADFDISYSSIKHIEVARGTIAHPVEGILIGGASGALIGGLIGSVAYSPCTSEEIMGCFMSPGSKSESAKIGAISGGLLLGLFGLLIGATSHTTQWQSVPILVPASISIVPSQFDNGGYHPMVTVRLPINRR